MDVNTFGKVIFVDRRNQNIATLEKSGDKWLVRSMNPATTGLHRPPYQMETPLGVYVIQEKKQKMFYMGDGTGVIEGYSPYASRFTRGGYIHGVPINNPEATQLIEFSASLGTTPRSHMCVRNATSHAKYVYEWAPTLEALVYIIE
jgi:lipoprotein-anchoring transpeptidase ErfK/SrfK